LSDAEEGKLAKEVAGEYNTLRVYLYMLKAEDSSSRDVQRALGFSSPTLAQHHLEKLRKYDLVSRDADGTYHVRYRSFGILKLYVRSGRWILPRTVFFAVLFGIMAVGFIALIPQHRYFWVASILSIVGLTYSIYETVRFYKVLPEVSRSEKPPQSGGR